MGQTVDSSFGAKLRAGLNATADDTPEDTFDFSNANNVADTAGDVGDHATLIKQVGDRSAETWPGKDNDTFDFADTRSDSSSQTYEPGLHGFPITGDWDGSDEFGPTSTTFEYDFVA